MRYTGLVPRGETPEPQRSRLLHNRAAEEDFPDAVRDAYGAGGSIRDIAEISGKSTNTIQRWLKEGR